VPCNFAKLAVDQKELRIVGSKDRRRYIAWTFYAMGHSSLLQCEATPGKLTPQNHAIAPNVDVLNRPDFG
jgi:hypothetical protein